MSFMNAMPLCSMYVGRTGGLVLILLRFSCSSIPLCQHAPRQEECIPGWSLFKEAGARNIYKKLQCSQSVNPEAFQLLHT
jgi:hypothetical protein